MRSEPRDSLPAMPASRPESVVHLPGDRVTIAGTYRPFGKLARREPSEEVATGLQVVHESWFEVGAVLPALTGFEGGGVWVREKTR